MSDLFAAPSEREVKKRRKIRAAHLEIFQIMTVVHQDMVRQHRVHNSGKFHLDDVEYRNRVAEEVLKYFIKKPVSKMIIGEKHED